jgi:DNA transformation protein
MAVRNTYVDFLLEQFEPLGDITSRAMFGGHALYCNGTIFALVAGNSLYLKADDANRQQFAQKGLRPFKPFADRDEVISYYEAPPEIFEDSDAMRKWVGSSVEAGVRGASKKKPKKKKAG